MFDRFSRSFELVKFSAGVLRKDKELLIFPLLSSIAAVLVLASFVPLFIAGADVSTQGQDVVVQGTVPVSADDNINLALYGLLYLVEYFVIFFFNSALVGAALIRMRGGDPTVGDGLRIATSKVGKILGYAMIAATVGLILRAISERVGFIGRIVIALLGVGWTVATYLTVPILVSRDIGPIDAVRESAVLLKATWGENLIANAGIGIFFYLVYFCVFAVFVLLAMTFGIPEAGEWVLGWAALAVLVFVVLALIQAALQGIFSAALYHYAADGDTRDGDIHEGDAAATTALIGAFRPK
jgi:hypothetical protein